MKSVASVIIPLFVALFLQSCSHSDCQETGSGSLSFYGFDSTALEKVVIKNYAAGSNFSRLTDSTVYLLSADTARLKRYDVVNDFVTWPYWAGIYSSRETIVEVPGAGQVYHIKDVTSTHAKSKYENNFLISSSKDGDVCYNVLESYNLEGNVINTGATVSYGRGTVKR